MKDLVNLCEIQLPKKNDSFHPLYYQHDYGQHCIHEAAKRTFVVSSKKDSIFIVYDNYYDLITLFLKYNFPSINT